MNCEDCRQNVESVPYIAFEAEMARQERTIKRLWILIIMLALLFVGSVVTFFVYESQFEDVVITAEQEADGGNNYAVGGDYNVE